MSAKSTITPISVGREWRIVGGMTVEEHFTALALQALLARPDFGRTRSDMKNAGSLAAMAAKSALDSIDS